MNKKFKQLNAFTLAEGGHSPLLYGDEGVAEGYSCVETKGHKVIHASKNMSFHIIKKAFTLAEVLITLGVIGVVAAMTLPSLISKYQEQVTVNHLLKTYSMLSQAVQRMQSDYGTIDTWGLSNTDTGQIDEETGKTIYDWSAQKIVAERLKPYLKVSKTCELGKICLNASSYTLSGQKIGDPAPVSASSDSPPEAKFFLADGTYIGLGWYGTYSGQTVININVILPPYNKKYILGKNRFYFELTPKGLLPEGLNDERNVFNNCDPKLTNNTLAGRGCAAWVIYNKNMDYLHCRDELSWNGKHSCK